MINASNLNSRVTMHMALLFILTASALQLGCGPGSSTNTIKNPGGGTTPGPSKAAKISLVTSSVFLQAANNSARVPLGNSDRELQNGDGIFTDDTGEAAVSFGECVKIYVYQHSGFVKGGCPKFDAQLGNTYCAVEGTTAFKDCATNLTTQSDSAVVSLEGTWVSMTYLKDVQYLKDLQLSVVLVFEGKGKAKPITDVKENTLGDATLVEAEHFWFTVPNNRLKDLAALKLNLEPRTSYPFERLPELLLRANLCDKSLNSVAEQSIKDRASSERIRPYFCDDRTAVGD